MYRLVHVPVLLTATWLGLAPGEYRAVRSVALLYKKTPATMQTWTKGLPDISADGEHGQRFCESFVC